MIEEIKKLHRLHSITKDFSHIIEYKTGSWKMFEPSRFIYSFFTFNSPYEINWSDSIHQRVADQKGNARDSFVLDIRKEEFTKAA
tara:strand:- start:2031 stop:2285 length:255 start_codon:yes stop_codon:yes gene_type:complete